MAGESNATPLRRRGHPDTMEPAPPCQPSGGRPLLHDHRFSRQPFDAALPSTLDWNQNNLTKKVIQKPTAIAAVTMNWRGETSNEVSLTIRPKASMLNIIAKNNGQNRPM